MGKFMLKDTRKELGMSQYNATCPIGTRVSSRYRFGDVAIVFNEIIAARLYINREVLRKALLDNPERTKNLLGLEIKDLNHVPTVVAKIVPIEHEAEPIAPVIASTEPEAVDAPEVMEPEEVEAELSVDSDTSELVLEVETTKEFDEAKVEEESLEDLTVKELTELANDSGIEVPKGLKKKEIISLIEEME